MAVKRQRETGNSMEHVRKKEKKKKEERNENVSRLKQLPRQDTCHFRENGRLVLNEHRLARRVGAALNYIITWDASSLRSVTRCTKSRGCRGVDDGEKWPSYHAQRNFSRAEESLSFNATRWRSYGWRNNSQSDCNCHYAWELRLARTFGTKELLHVSYIEWFPFLSSILKMCI